MRNAGCLALSLMAGFAWGSDQRSCVSTPVEAVAIRMSAQAQDWPEGPFDRVEWTSVSPWPFLMVRDIDLPANPVRSRVPVALTGTDCASGQEVRHSVWFKLSLYRSVWIYGLTAGVDEPLARAKPEKRLRDLAAMGVPVQELVGDSEVLSGLWLARQVAGGQPILKSHLQVEPLVFRNREVGVVVKAEGLRLRTRGKALQSGQSGDSVPVMIEGATASAMAVVSGKGEVQIEP